MQCCVYFKENDKMLAELQNAVNKLNKLCTSTQIVRESGIAGGDIRDKVHSYIAINQSIYIYHYKLLLLDNIIFRALKIRYLPTVQWESLAGGKFGQLTLFELLAKEKFGELIDQPIGY